MGTRVMAVRSQELWLCYVSHSTIVSQWELPTTLPSRVDAMQQNISSVKDPLGPIPPSLLYFSKIVCSWQSWRPRNLLEGVEYFGDWGCKLGDLFLQADYRLPAVRVTPTPILSLSSTLFPTFGMLAPSTVLLFVLQPLYLCADERVCVFLFLMCPYVRASLCLCVCLCMCLCSFTYVCFPMWDVSVCVW